MILTAVPVGRPMVVDRLTPVGRPMVAGKPTAVGRPMVVGRPTAVGKVTEAEKMAVGGLMAVVDTPHWRNKKFFDRKC